MLDVDGLVVLAGVPAVLIIGISKGGFGGGLGVLSVLIMSLVVTPRMAAGIMLPILCLMDVMAIWVWRKHVNWRLLGPLAPAALVGILFGTLTFEYLSVAHLKLMIGIIAVAFTFHWVIKNSGKTISKSNSGSRPWLGATSGAIAGFTSFVAHAGGPPISMYMIPLALPKAVFQATTVWFFFVVNCVKLVPYAALDMLSLDNLTASVILLPLAPVGVIFGVWLHHRISQRMFYSACYIFLFITGLKLIYDGLVG